MNIYFCQFSELLDNNIYLPYSVGIIISYLKTLEYIKHYDYRILFIKEDIQKMIQRIEYTDCIPDYMFFSVYIWNFNYSVKLAKLIKEKYPECKIIFGGHHVPFDCAGFFEEHPFIDIIVRGEGEIICGEILQGKELSEIDNIAYNVQGMTIINKVKFTNIDLNTFPSPYLTGIFDDILNLPYDFTASLETNRGCPFGCAYCDWGSSKTSPKRLRFFNQERVFQEIEWFGKNKIGFLLGCDSNFGIAKNDILYTDFLIKTRIKYGYPKKFRVCYTKNSNEVVFDINSKLNKYGMSKGATLSVQSLNSETLKTVGRVNLTERDFQYLLNKYNRFSIPTYTEIILGLPMETLETFKQGLCRLLEYGQHSSIVIYQCQVYPNSEINSKEYRRKYELKTVKVPMHLPHNTIYYDNLETEEVIIGTNAMNDNDYIDACMFAWVIQTFHCLGLTQLIARYLYMDSNISYYDFYNVLLQEIIKRKNYILNKEYIKVYNKYKGLSEGKGLYYLLDETKTLNWTLEEGSYLTFMLNKKDVYFELYDILKELNPCVWEAIKLNGFLIREFEKETLEMNLDSKYLNILKSLEIKHNLTNNLILKPKKSFSSFYEYAVETIWYGRKGGKFFYNIDEIV